MLLDWKHALRLWRRDPRFTGVASLTLALGIAATTTIFSVVNGILLRPFPYRDPDRLAVLWEPNQVRPIEALRHE